MLDDLLDAPLIRIRCRGANLGLSGVESLEGDGYLSLELLENGIHGRRITVHRKREFSPELLKLRQSFAGLFDLVAFGFDL